MWALYCLCCRVWSCVEWWLCMWRTCSVPGRSSSHCPQVRSHCSDLAPSPAAAFCQKACSVAPGESLRLSGPVTPVRAKTLGKTKRWQEERPMSSGTQNPFRVGMESKYAILSQIAGGTSKVYPMGPPITYTLQALPNSHLWRGSHTPG